MSTPSTSKYTTHLRARACAAHTAATGRQSARACTRNWRAHAPCVAVHVGSCGPKRGDDAKADRAAGARPQRGAYACGCVIVCLSVCAIACDRVCTRACACVRACVCVCLQTIDAGPSEQHSPEHDDVPIGRRVHAREAPLHSLADDHTARHAPVHAHAHSTLHGSRSAPGKARAARAAAARAAAARAAAHARLLREGARPLILRQVEVAHRVALDLRALAAGTGPLSRAG